MDREKLEKNLAEAVKNFEGKCIDTLESVFNEAIGDIAVEIDMAGQNFKCHNDYLINKNYELSQELAALKAENERLNGEKIAIVPSFERLRELNIATAFITLDRLKEICKAVRLVDEPVYLIEGEDANRYTADYVMVENDNITLGLSKVSRFIEGATDETSTDINNPRLFYGTNARERATARLKELEGKK